TFRRKHRKNVRSETAPTVSDGFNKFKRSHYRTFAPFASFAATLPAAAEANLSLAAKHVFLEQNGHAFQYLAQVVRPPGLPAFGFILEYAVVEPFAFDGGLNGELLQLLKRC